MTRKDYIKTANILKSFVDEIPQTTYEDLVNEFAEWFKSDNENFDFFPQAYPQALRVIKNTPQIVQIVASDWILSV